jgi:hypothetical protein
MRAPVQAVARNFRFCFVRQPGRSYRLCPLPLHPHLREAVAQGVAG